MNTFLFDKYLNVSFPLYLRFETLRRKENELFRSKKTENTGALLSPNANLNICEEILEFYFSFYKFYTNINVSVGLSEFGEYT